jgi:hypothetical protein
MENTLTKIDEEITSQWNIIIHYYKKMVHWQKNWNLTITMMNHTLVVLKHIKLYKT